MTELKIKHQERNFKLNPSKLLVEYYIYEELIDKIMEEFCLKRERGYISDLKKYIMENFNIEEKEANKIIDLLSYLGYISIGASKISKQEDKKSELTWKSTRYAYYVYLPWYKLIFHELVSLFRNR